jgi:arginine exporter protein ArgO
MIIARNVAFIIATIIGLIGVSYYRINHGAVESFIVLFGMIFSLLYAPIAYSTIVDELHRKRRKI